MTEHKDPLEPTVGRQSKVHEMSEDEIDRNLLGTFPASDPPSWTLGVEREKQPASETQME